MHNVLHEKSFLQINTKVILELFPPLSIKIQGILKENQQEKCKMSTLIIKKVKENEEGSHNESQKDCS